MMSRLAGLFLVLLSGAVIAQSGGDLEGRVTDRDGVGLLGANIKVEGAQLAEPMGAIAGQDGKYKIAGLMAGTYTVTVSFIGYKMQVEDEVEIKAGSSTRLDVVLKQGIIDLEQSIVTASRRPEKALDAPASVIVVEAEDIENEPVLSVAEHLKDMPAVDFAQTGLAQSNAVVRGFNNIFSGALLTLTDNRIARVPSLRLNAYNFIPLTNDDIERIEVVLGPGSALYGPNSANGVMHIITHSPFTSAGTDVSVGLGERSLRKVEARHAGAVNEKLAYKVSASYYTGNDWEYTDPTEARDREAAIKAGANPSTLKIGARDFDVERQSLEARVDYRPRPDLTTVVSAGYNSANNIELTGLGAGQVRDWVLGYFQVRATYQDWFAQLYRNWNDAGDTFLLTSGDGVVDKSAMTVFQLQHSASLGRRQSFIYGIDALLTRPDTKGTITGQNEDEDDIDEIGLYLQSKSELAEMLDLVLALRYDDHNRLDDAELSPRAALVYKPKETQTFRLTYNRAFSTPTTNNLYLDLVTRNDVFGIGAIFEEALRFNPGVDLRAQGTFRKGFDDGFTFRRVDENDASSNPMFRSSFQPAIALALATRGLNPGDPGYAIDADGYMAMDHPLVTNVMWGIGRGAVFSQLPEQATGLIALQLMAANPDMSADVAQATASAQIQALVAALDPIVPQTLGGLENTLARFNLEKGLAGDPAPFDPVSGAVDVRRTESTITQTFELGYKGVLADKWVVAADVYRTKTEDFVGPLGVETPSVFLDPRPIVESLEGIFTQAFDVSPALAGGLALLDQLPPGALAGVESDGDGTAADELAQIFASGAASIPFGTVSPEQSYDSTAVLLTYRNFGDVTLNGLDLSVAYYPNSTLRLTGNYSYVSDDFFPKLGGIADVALNAPKHKVKVGASYALPQWDLQVGGQVRYQDAFPMNSGVFVGDVDSYTVFDLDFLYRLPVEQDLTLKLDIDNALDNEHREFVGAPEIGRLTFVQLGASF